MTRLALLAFALALILPTRYARAQEEPAEPVVILEYRHLIRDADGRVESRQYRQVVDGVPEAWSPRPDWEARIAAATHHVDAVGPQTGEPLVSLWDGQTFVARATERAAETAAERTADQAKRDARAALLDALRARTATSAQVQSALLSLLEGASAP